MLRHAVPFGCERSIQVVVMLCRWGILAWTLALTSGIACAVTAAGAADTEWSTAIALPTAQVDMSGYACSGSKWHVRPAGPHDLAGGSTRGIPATQIVVLNGVGGWDDSAPTMPPAVVVDAKPALRNRVGLFKADEEVGWIAVPRGWRVRCAGEGADGGDMFMFTAPRGSRDGWLMVAADNGVSVGSYAGALGYFEGASARMAKAFPPSAPQGHLEPTPESLTHPDPCTAVVRYRSEGLAVAGVVRRFPDGGSATRMFAALPPQDAKLRDFLITAFMQSRGRGETGCPTPHG